MKKIIMLGILFFGITMNCHAETLNYRTNMLMDYEYQVENQKYIFQAYENNETDRFIFTTIPIQMPSYETNYYKLKFKDTNLNSKKWNRLKKYMWMTQIEEDFLTKLNYYIGTQVLIWQHFHPEIKVSMDGLEEKIKALEQLNITPSWIHDYEIEEELKLKKYNEYKLSSSSCEVKEDEQYWNITNCNEDATIIVSEILDEEALIYYNDQGIELFESGRAPVSWEMKIIKKEMPEEIPEENGKDEEDNLEEELPPSENTPSKIEQTNEEEKQNVSLNKEDTFNKIRIENVPNTEEYKNDKSFFMSFFLLLIALRWKNLKSGSS